MTFRYAGDGKAIMDLLDIGSTPLVLLPGVSRAGSVWLKAEYANPFGSVKDRTAAYLLAWARDTYGRGVSVVESTSGNVGIALAEIGQKLGISVTLVMDASIPTVRIEEVRRSGASVVVVEHCKSGMTLRESRIATAQELGCRQGWLWLNQYANEAGLHAHEQTTGPEIWTELDGNVDAVVASVGTGSTICGIGAALRLKPERPMIVGVEPVGSTISGGTHGDYLPAGSGMRGAPGIIDRYRDLVDYFAKVPDHLSAAWSLYLLRRFGLEVGPTTGAAVAVASMLAEQCNAQVTAIAPDRGRAFRSRMRELALSAPVPGDSTQIQIASFGTGIRPRPTAAEEERKR